MSTSPWLNLALLSYCFFLQASESEWVEASEDEDDDEDEDASDGEGGSDSNDETDDGEDDDDDNDVKVLSFLMQQNQMSNCSSFHPSSPRFMNDRRIEF